MYFIYFVCIFYFCSDVNCGGNGTNFLYFPPEVINSCTYYEWEAIVFHENNNEIIETVVLLCGVEFISPPVGLSIFCNLKSTLLISFFFRELFRYF